MTDLHRRALKESGATAAGALVLFGLTAARHPQFGDGLEFMAAAAVLGVPHPTGYPLLTLLLAPLAGGEGAYLRGAQLCALFGALAVFGATWLARELCGWRPGDPANRWTPPVVGALFAASAGLWSAATIVEAYALNAALVLGVLALLLPGGDAGPGPRRLAAGLFLFGLAMTNHLTAGALLPLVAWRWAQCLRRRGPRSPAPWLALAAGAVALSLWLYVPVRASADPPVNWGDAGDLAGFMWLVGGGDYRATQFLQARPGVPFDSEAYGEFFWRRAGDLVASTGLQFLGGTSNPRDPERVGGFAIGLGMLWLAYLGARQLWARAWPGAAALAAAALLQLVLVFTYNIRDIGDYYLGIWVVLLPPWILGTESILRRLGGALGYWQDARRARRMLVALCLVTGAVVLSNSGVAARAANPAAREWMAAVAAYLESVDEPVLVLTHGDYDTYALWYMVLAEGRVPGAAVVGANFLRQPWYETMLPGGVDVRVEPGSFASFTLEDHVAMLARNVIEPNRGTHRIVTTSGDALAVNALAARYDLRPVARLLSEERLEALAGDGAPALPPHLLIEVR